MSLKDAKKALKATAKELKKAQKLAKESHKQGDSLQSACEDNVVKAQAKHQQAQATYYKLKRETPGRWQQAKEYADEKSLTTKVVAGTTLVLVIAAGIAATVLLNDEDEDPVDPGSDTDDL